MYFCGREVFVIPQGIPAMHKNNNVVSSACIS